jgi:hypothetical protein
LRVVDSSIVGASGSSESTAPHKEHAFFSVEISLRHEGHLVIGGALYHHPIR